MYIELYRNGSNNKHNSDPTGYIKIFPNPFDTEFRANFELIGNSNVTVRIFDKYGMIVWQKHLGMQEAGKHSIRLEPDIKPGLYVLNIAAGNQVLRTKIVKKKN